MVGGIYHANDCRSGCYIYTVGEIHTRLQLILKKVISSMITLSWVN